MLRRRQKGHDSRGILEGDHQDSYHTQRHNIGRAGVLISIFSEGVVNGPSRVISAPLSSRYGIRPDRPFSKRTTSAGRGCLLRLRATHLRMPPCLSAFIRIASHAGRLFFSSIPGRVPRSFVACVGRGNAELRHAGFEPIRFWRIRFWHIRFWHIRFWHIRWQ